MHAHDGTTGLLRTAALWATLLGAAASFVFFIRAGERTPRLLLLIMMLWVLSPFVALVMAHRRAPRWPSLVRSTLYVLMLVIPLVSLAVFADDARAHRRPQAAFVYVLVPPVCWLLVTFTVSLAAVISRKRSRATTRPSTASPPRAGPRANDS